MLEFFSKRASGSKDEILSGITVALALVPEAVAFALIAGVSPLTGLYAAFTVGFVTSLVGGRPGMISGATGAMAVVVVSLIQEHGVAYLFPAVVLAGVLQVLVGLARLGKLIRLVPHPVMLGFVNGLAILIFLAQFQSFQTAAADGRTGPQWMTGQPLAVMATLVALTMAIIYILPRWTRAVPSTLVAILSISLLSTFLLPLFGLETSTVRDLAGSLKGGLPPFSLVTDPLTWGTVFSMETLRVILPYSMILAGVGLIESLMTMSLIDEITETRGQGNRECVGQGVANILTGMFGGMGGCAMIGQSLINVNAGGRRRLSGIVAAVCLMAFVLFLSPLVERIPMAALVGVMFCVAIGTFEWTTIRTFRSVPVWDTVVLLVVTLVTLFVHNLALAVLLGVIFSALVFAWQHSSHLMADHKTDDCGAKRYQLHGPLYFASVSKFRDLFDPANDPENVVVDFYYSRVYDHSAIEAIHTLSERYARLDKRLHLQHLSPDCRRKLRKMRRVLAVRVSEQPHLHISTNQKA
jgi:sulfate permease, SulP family